MKIWLVEDYNEMSRVAGCFLLHEIMADKARKNLYVASGDTPFGMYDFLAPVIRHNPVLSGVYFYSADETTDDTGTYHTNLELTKERFLVPAGIPEDHFVVLDESNYAGYDQRIAGDGGLDAGFMSIGSNGLLICNTPPTSFGSAAHRVPLPPEFVEALAPLFEGKGTMSDHCVTMGIKTILNTRRLYVSVSGERKADAVLRALYEQPDEDCPSSALQLHPDVTLIIDKAAARRLLEEGLLASK